MITTSRHPSIHPTGISTGSTSSSSKDRERDTPSSFEVANVVVNQASIVLPFSPRIAYFAFSDFSRHAEWNPHLTKVEYTDASRHEARWTMESFGIKFGWSTVPVRKEPNKLIVWRSVKGLQLQGRAEFEPTPEGHTQMLFTLTYVAARKVKPPLSGSNKRESAQLKMMLEAFSDAVVKDIEKSAVGEEVQSKAAMLSEIE